MSVPKIILDLCAGTGAWSEPYRASGYDVRRVTLPVDVRLWCEYTGLKVHGVLAAPPCTCFSSSGARWARTDAQMIEALSIVDACLRIVMVAQPVWWALENPVGKLVRFLGKPTMYFQPWEFGDPYSKKTCLWGEFSIPRKLRDLKHDSPKHNRPVLRFPSRMHLLPPSANRATLRSITPEGFARAFFEANP